VSLSAEEFLPHLARRLPEEVDDYPQLIRTRGGDLYLTCACVRGDPQAHAALWSRYAPEIDAALRRRGVPADQCDDIKQEVYLKLLGRQGGGEPKIATYSSKSALRTWLCVVAVRDAYAHLQRRDPARWAADSGTDELAGPTGDPELDYLKQAYGAEFREAVREALAALSPKERNLLRYQAVEGLSIDEIGALYRVHRATAARWLAAVRQRISEQSREALVRKLGIDEAQLRSIQLLVASQLDVSLSLLMRG
jgi:RNA polymerase sigma-70 factor (ECF subfamily)